MALAIYGFIATQLFQPFHLERPAGGYYPLLTESLLHGRLDLLIRPSPILTQLEAPYDKSKNVLFRLHDASLFNGKYYLYFGLTPLIVFLPYRLITGQNMSEPFAAYLFFLATSALIILFLYRSMKNVSSLNLGLGAMAILASSGLPLVLARPWFYEVAALAGLFFGFATLLLFYEGVSKPKDSGSKFFLLGSIASGLAIGCRPHFILLPFLAGWISIYLLKENRKRELIASWLPWGFSLFLLGIYNYVRFENPFEFGINYSLGGNTVDYPYLISRIPGLLYVYLLTPPVFDSSFPFIHNGLGKIPQILKFDDANHYGSSMVGLLWTCPALLLNLKSTPLDRPLKLLSRCLLTVGGFYFMFFLVYVGSVGRYFLDFAPYLIAFAVIRWLHGIPTAFQKSVCAFGILMGLAIGVGGFGESERGNAERDPVMDSELVIPPNNSRPIVTIETPLGPVKVSLFSDLVPKSVSTFLDLTNRFYSSTYIYRITPGYVLEMGSRDKLGKQGSGIAHESELKTRGFHYYSGMLFMVDIGRRHFDSQFGISLSPTPWLIGRSEVIGQVVSGMDVLERLSKLPRDSSERPLSDLRISLKSQE